MTNITNTNKLTITQAWEKRGYKIIKKMMNLIVAPAGSGKTYFIFKKLIKDYNLKRTLFLVDTSNLRDGVIMNKEYSQYCKLYNKLDANGFNDFLNDDKNGKITVMTYALFSALLNNDADIFRNIECVICDEAHNLINYQSRFDNKDEEEGKKYYYKDAINKLIQMKSYADVILMTATPQSIEYSDLRKSGNFVEFNITDDEIRKYTEKKRVSFNQLSNVVTNIKKYADFENGKKVVIYTEKISSIQKIEKQLNEMGLKTVGLWSMNAKKHKMNDYQRNVRETLLSEEVIPSNVDVLIINASYETGINILNKNVDCVVVNSTRKDTLVQSRNRVRCDIPLLLYKDNTVADDVIIEVPNEYIGVRLTTKEKNELVNKLNLVDTCNRPLKWKGLKTVIDNNGYIVEEKSTTIKVDGKRKKLKYTMITEKKVEQPIELSKESAPVYVVANENENNNKIIIEPKETHTNDTNNVIELKQNETEQNEPTTNKIYDKGSFFMQKNKIENKINEITNKINNNKKLKAIGTHSSYYKERNFLIKEKLEQISNKFKKPTTKTSKYKIANKIIDIHYKELPKRKNLLMKKIKKIGLNIVSQEIWF